jgi:dTDP-6-deoxy-L-talose 4-dehydrogenase (NAD+)
MRIAVTGATGFIGRHVLSELAHHSVEVVAVMRNLSTANFSVTNKVETVQMDMANSTDKAFDRLGRPDVLIHLAWGGLPNYRSLHHFEQELPMQYLFLSELIHSGLGSLVVTGTCFEYGMQSGQLSEFMETHPDNPYGFAKDTLRRQLEYLHNNDYFAFTWARLFYLYGDDQSENSLQPQLKRSVEQGCDTFNMSGGEQLRDYLSVTDVAKNLVMLATHKANIGIVNICSGKPVSVRKLVESWIDENNWNIKLNLGHYSYPNYEPLAFWGDCSKLDKYKQEEACVMYDNNISPIPHHELRDRVSGSIDAKWFDESGAITVNEWSRALASIGKQFGDFKTIVDFGCGCGRTLRHLALQMLPDQKLIGLDPDREAIEWLENNYHGDSISAFTLNDEPPSRLEDESVDLILSHSVFTHLPEDVHFAWLQELSRVLKRDAILVVSFHGEKVVDGYYSSLVSLGRVQEAKEFLTSMSTQGFFHVAGRRDVEMPLPIYYGAAFHTISYITEKWLTSFQLLGWFPMFALNLQDVLLLRKK